MLQFRYSHIPHRLIHPFTAWRFLLHALNWKQVLLTDRYRYFYKIILRENTSNVVVYGETLFINEPGSVAYPLFIPPHGLVFVNINIDEERRGGRNIIVPDFGGETEISQPLQDS